jgi:hemerythrin superfamily protein
MATGRQRSAARKNVRKAAAGAKEDDMNAIKLLKQQHREVEALFKQLAKGKSAGPRRKAFEKIADALAVHATIEEKYFYPSVRQRATEGILLESLEEHLAIKRVIADLLDLDASDATFDAKIKVLKDEVEHHVEEEEGGLFPKVAKLLDDDDLETIGEAMERKQEQLLAEGSPREAVPSETEHAATL